MARRSKKRTTPRKLAKLINYLTDSEVSIEELVSVYGRGFKQKQVLKIIARL